MNKEKRKPIQIKPIELPVALDVEIIKVQPRYLGTLTSNPNNANIWDYYYNGTNMRLFTESGWKTV